MKRILCAFLAAYCLIAFAGLEEKINFYIPLEKDLSVITADGEKEEGAVFVRSTIARTPDFKETAIKTPRFWNGGLFLEPGGKTPERGSRNMLPAKEDPFDKTKGNVKEEKGMTPGAFSFSGSVQLKPVALKIHKNYISTRHIFSFYAKGEGTLQFSPVLILKSGKKQMLEEQKITLDKDWKRYFIAFECGDSKKPGDDPIDAFYADFTGENVAIDAPMLETPCFYSNVRTPTTYIPNGEFRDFEQVMFPVIVPENGMEGAFSCFFTLIGYNDWIPLFYIGKGWAKDFALSYHPYSYGGQLRINEFRNLRNYNCKGNNKIKLNRKYHLLVNYTKNNCAVYLDGKAVINTPTAAPVDFKFENLYLGSNNCASSNAVIEKVVIFNKALTPEEITLITSPDFPKLRVK